MLTTRFTELIGCTAPIQQAGMGFEFANPRLAAAVSNAGGLGVVSVYGQTPERVVQLLDIARGMTDKPIGANFLNPGEWGPVECIEAAANRAQVVDFFWAEPDPKLVKIAHDGGALASWQVGSRPEALAAVDAGCDFVIVQGIEAGGHVYGRIGLLALLEQVLEAVDVPVLAGGGIGSGRALAAALAAGADGVRVGTRFVAAEEANAHPTYTNALIGAEARDTIYTEAYSYNFPDAPHRVLRASIEAAEKFKEGEVVGENIDPDTGQSHPVHRFEPLAVHKGVSGAVEAMPFWAGESVGGVKKLQPAAEIVRELVDEAEHLLRRFE